MTAQKLDASREGEGLMAGGRGREQEIPSRSEMRQTGHHCPHHTQRAVIGYAVKVCLEGAVLASFLRMEVVQFATDTKTEEPADDNESRSTCLAANLQMCWERMPSTLSG